MTAQCRKRATGRGDAMGTRSGYPCQDGAGGSPDLTRLRSQSPKNGNIRGEGRRLSAFSTSSSAKREARDGIESAKSRDFRPISRVSWEAGPNAGLPGWRRSAVRTRLQSNSLLTGNFTGNFAFLRLREAISQRESAVPQRFFTKFPMQINRETFLRNRELFYENREFQVQNC